MKIPYYFFVTGIFSLGVMVFGVSSCKKKTADGDGGGDPNFTAASQIPIGQGIGTGSQGGVTVGGATTGQVDPNVIPVPSPSVTPEVTPLPVGTPISLTNRHGMFVTSERYDGNLGGFAGADKKCQDLAVKVNLGGAWMAMLSTSAQSAKNRIVIKAGFSLQNMKGEILAATKNDLWDGQLSKPVGFDETGKSPDVGPDAKEAPQMTDLNDRALALNFVWSGTQDDGDRETSLRYEDANCLGWTSNVAATQSNQSKGNFGRFDQADSQWIRRQGNTIIDGDSYDCSRKRHLYCISQ